MREMSNMYGTPFTDNGRKPDQTKEPEAAPGKETEKKEPPEDKKVLVNHVLKAVKKKPRSQSLIPVYVRVSVQRYNFLRQCL